MNNQRLEVEIQEIELDQKAFSTLPRIGSGGQSNVYKYETNENTFAIKKLSNLKRVDRFNLEIQAMKRLHDEGRRVAQIYYYKVNEKFAYYVMPYFANGSLDSSWGKILKEKTIEEKVNTFLALSLELNKIHSAGYIHRDIKAENILIDDNETLLFSDFGISYTKEFDETRITETDEIIGSRHWTAPELHNGISANGSEAGDYFSMGKLLYFILTGNRLLGIGVHDEAKLELIPDGIRPILNTMLSIDPSVRARLWNDCLTALSSIISNKPSESIVEVNESAARIATANIIEKRSKEIKWNQLTLDLKNQITTRMKSPRISEILSPFLSNNMIDWFHDCGNVGTLKWVTTHGEKLLRNDDGKNAAIRIWSKNAKIYYSPIVMIGNEGSSNYEAIKLAIGIGIQGFSQSESGWPKPSSDSSWIIESDVDSPLLGPKVDEMIKSAEERYFAIICKMIADEYWLSPRPSKLSSFIVE